MALPVPTGTSCIMCTVAHETMKVSCGGVGSGFCWLLTSFCKHYKRFIILIAHHFQVLLVLFMSLLVAFRLDVASLATIPASHTTTAGVLWALVLVGFHRVNQEDLLFAPSLNQPRSLLQSGFLRQSRSRRLPYTVTPPQ